MARNARLEVWLMNHSRRTITLPLVAFIALLSPLESPLAQKSRALYTPFYSVRQDPINVGIPEAIGWEYQLLYAHQSCHDPADTVNMHLVLVKSYAPDPHALGRSVTGPVYQDGFSILFCEHIDRDAGGDVYYREMLGTLAATHELGHHRGITDEACVYCEPYPGPCEPSPYHWSNGALDPDCVMARFKTVYFEDLGHRATYSRCSDTNVDLLYHIRFCDDCCERLRDVGW